MTSVQFIKTIIALNKQFVTFRISAVAMRVRLFSAAMTPTDDVSRNAFDESAFGFVLYVYDDKKKNVM